jgi:prevent-host-death family protein
MKDISVAEAKDRLTQILRFVESGNHVHITRRGKAVAVLLSVEAFAELHKKRSNFAEALAEFNARADAREAIIDDDFMMDLRTSHPGREIEL